MRSGIVILLLASLTTLGIFFISSALESCSRNSVEKQRIGIERSRVETENEIRRTEQTHNITIQKLLTERVLSDHSWLIFGLAGMFGLTVFLFLRLVGLSNENGELKAYVNLIQGGEGYGRTRIHASIVERIDRPRQRRNYGPPKHEGTPVQLEG